MSVSLRRMRYEDLESMQDCNVNCLPENYQLKVRAARRAELSSTSTARSRCARSATARSALTLYAPPPPPCALSTGCTTR